MLLNKDAVEKQKKSFDYWFNRNKYYYKQLLSFYQFAVPEGYKVLQVNCKNGFELASLKPSYGIGVDQDVDAISIARGRYPQYQWYTSLQAVVPQSFDYIILTSVTMEEDDIQNLFMSLKPYCSSSTRIVVDACSYLWEPLLWLTQKLGLRRPTLFKNWISRSDLHNFLYLAGFDVVTTYRHTLLPLYIPLISAFFNSIIVHIPLICRLCLHDVTVARVAPAVEQQRQNVSVSVVIPCRNERGNIEAAVNRCPSMGVSTEIIFVEGHSKDDTLQEVQRVARAYPHKNISWYQQDGKGKGDAVRKGFAHARGDVLMILDADLTVPPEELPKFFDALVSGKGELINGSRLIYGLESDAMWFLSVYANFFFRVLLSWLLSQKVTDTLCGTKVLFKSDYDTIARNRGFFGNFDPFGDFDLLFGAARLNLKITDMPIHYKSRTYGTTQINRFWHGWILVGMSILALRKLKLR